MPTTRGAMVRAIEITGVGVFSYYVYYPPDALIDPEIGEPYESPGNGTIVDPQYYSTSGAPILTLSVASTSLANLQAAINSVGSSTWYEYQSSLLDGNVNLSLPSSFAPGVSLSDIEIGGGGTATVMGAANSDLSP